MKINVIKRLLIIGIAVIAIFYYFGCASDQNMVYIGHLKFNGSIVEHKIFTKESSLEFMLGNSGFHNAYVWSELFASIHFKRFVSLRFGEGDLQIYQLSKIAPQDEFSARLYIAVSENSKEFNHDHFGSKIEEMINEYAYTDSVMNNLIAIQRWEDADDARDAAELSDTENLFRGARNNVVEFKLAQ